MYPSNCGIVFSQLFAVWNKLIIQLKKLVICIWNIYLLEKDPSKSIAVLHLLLINMIFNIFSDIFFGPFGQLIQVNMKMAVKIDVSVCGWHIVVRMYDSGCLFVIIWQACFTFCWLRRTQVCGEHCKLRLQKFIQLLYFCCINVIYSWQKIV